MTQKNVFWKFLGLLENRLMIYIVSIIMMTTFYAVFEVTGSLFVKSIFDIAEKGNYEAIKELQEIMTKPYEEQTKEIEDKYYTKKPSDFFGIAGISHVSCSS